MLARCMHICYTKIMNKPVYNVRIDPELYELLVLEAKEQGRSATSQVNYMLRVAIVRGLTRPVLTLAQKKAAIEQRKARFVARNLRRAKTEAMNEVKYKEYKVDQEL